MISGPNLDPILPALKLNRKSHEICMDEFSINQSSPCSGNLPIRVEVADQSIQNSFLALILIWGQFGSTLSKTLFSFIIFGKFKSKVLPSLFDQGKVQS